MAVFVSSHKWSLRGPILFLVSILLSMHLQNLLEFSTTLLASSISCPCFALLIAFLRVLWHLYSQRDCLVSLCLNLTHSSFLLNRLNISRQPGFPKHASLAFYPNRNMRSLYSCYLTFESLPLSVTPLPANRPSQSTSASSCLQPPKSD